MVFALLSEAKAQTSTVHGMNFVSFATCRGCFDIYFKAFFQAKHTRIHKHEKKHEKNGKIEKIIQNFNSMKLF